ncbi:Lipoprotein-releasing system permease protein [Ignavibacterium album JCM 16511]|uniref:Lipoprotein-releasing system permease protein n=1 Tax=Ignavibacterium album (strain DSM 19864 / JCM 16511 / NBRC 101810 / Mat9-16) TaxID=945713 RepID=I0AJQ8_IGNAJ|nr:Lipoprotein-releasing system permease protein [Ignavibacterium album JCM 16511]
MNLSFFIFKKYIKSNRDSRFLNLISTIAISGIALGVATLIIALSVISGFEKTLTKKLTDIDSHIKVFSFKSNLPSIDNALTNIDSICGKKLDYASPFLSNLALISFKNRKDGVTIKGFYNVGYKNKILENIIDGNLNLDSANTLILGKTLANKLLIKVGDIVTLFALRNNQIPSPDNLPNIENFKVTGIFESGIAEYDASIAFTDLHSAQNLFSMPEEVNGIDIKLNDISKADSLTNLLRRELTYPYFARSIFDLHKNIFTWISLQKKPIPIILGLIIVVAVFNIVGTLLLMVIERTNSIGILKSFGTKKRQIIQIFLLQGFYLAILGTIAGNILALALIEIQTKFNIIKVPSSIYFVTKVPFDLSFEIFLIVSFITIVLALLASLIPSIISSRINPVTALRFD